MATLAFLIFLTLSGANNPLLEEIFLQLFPTVLLGYFIPALFNSLDGFLWRTPLNFMA